MVVNYISLVYFLILFISVQVCIARGVVGMMLHASSGIGIRMYISYINE